MDKSGLERFFRNESTASEREKAIRFLSDPKNDLLLKHWLKDNWDLVSNFNSSEHNVAADPEAQKVWLNIQSKIRANEDRASPLSEERPSLVSKAPIISFSTFGTRARAFAAAAILIFIISGLGYFLYSKPGEEKAAHQIVGASPVVPSDIAPPKASKAVLTLANGKEIFLDSSGNGTLANEGNMSIVKTNEGEIVYKGHESSLIGYNTLSLPKGSKPMRLALSDGSIVWLNAASSVTYPSAFNEKDRKVSITGEAYFEVAKSNNQPFIVNHRGVSVKVLGTHFNVNTYEDENDIKITLLEGSVDVSGGGINNILRPGQQARVSQQGTKVSDLVDLEEVMAWKNGQFYFGGNNIKSIMRQIEKYYDVEVEYKDDVPYQFVAKISRQVNVSEFLEKLELTNLIHFTIAGKKIIVTK
jgi:transmembrane sensor